MHTAPLDSWTASMKRPARRRLATAALIATAVGAAWWAIAVSWLREGMDHKNRLMEANVLRTHVKSVSPASPVALIASACAWRPCLHLYVASGHDSKPTVEDVVRIVSESCAPTTNQRAASWGRMCAPPVRAPTAMVVVTHVDSGLPSSCRRAWAVNRFTGETRELKRC